MNKEMPEKLQLLLNQIKNDKYQGVHVTCFHAPTLFENIIGNLHYPFWVIQTNIEDKLSSGKNTLMFTFHDGEELIRPYKRNQSPLTYDPITEYEFLNLLVPSKRFAGGTI